MKVTFSAETVGAFTPALSVSKCLLSADQPVNGNLISASVKRAQMKESGLSLVVAVLLTKLFALLTIL